jgi:hypothetical protein
VPSVIQLDRDHPFERDRLPTVATKWLLFRLAKLDDTDPEKSAIQAELARRAAAKAAYDEQVRHDQAES